jgi:hypothetical protein
MFDPFRVEARACFFFSPDCDPGLFTFDPFRVVAMLTLFPRDCDPGLFMFDPFRVVPPLVHLPEPWSDLRRWRACQNAGGLCRCWRICQNPGRVQHE